MALLGSPETADFKFFEEDVFCDLAYKRSSELGLPTIWCQRPISQLLQFGFDQARTLEDLSLDTSTFDAKKSYIRGLAVTSKYKNRRAKKGRGFVIGIRGLHSFRTLHLNRRGIWSSQRTGRRLRRNSTVIIADASPWMTLWMISGDSIARRSREAQ